MCYFSSVGNIFIVHSFVWIIYECKICIIIYYNSVIRLIFGMYQTLFSLFLFSLYLHIKFKIQKFIEPVKNGLITLESRSVWDQKISKPPLKMGYWLENRF